MATRFHPTHSRAAAVIQRRNVTNHLTIFRERKLSWRCKQLFGNNNSATRISRIKAGNEGGDSYLDMWKKAKERERSSLDFERIAAESDRDAGGGEQSDEELEKRSREFEKLLEVPAEERDKVQRMQVVDRAAAALAAARALLKDSVPTKQDVEIVSGGDEMEDLEEGKNSESIFLPQSSNSGIGTPGPSFWAWAPPPLLDDDDDNDDNLGQLKPVSQASSSPAQSIPVLERDQSLESLSIPFETSMLQSSSIVPLPPLQSLVEVEKTEVIRSTEEKPHMMEENKLGVEFSTHAAEASEALSSASKASTQGVNPDGSRWWKETGIEQRPDGVLCKWTVTRNVSADRAVEWEDKYWEAADELGYKELGSEKCGRDSTGNVWREYWRESMMEIDGAVHLEKTAEKWGKNMQGTEWQEKWWEHYGVGKSEKWADKWCSIDPHTSLELGHAHVWHERWGEEYDGHGGSTKYTDKWAERFEGDGWSKWGDKWDEHFDQKSHGVKQGETWWEGKYGERWNRAWGESHNGSGWVHKYGKSSSGEHWDTHEQQDTWYERFLHYGFYHCFENSTQLRNVKKPSDWS